MCLEVTLTPSKLARARIGAERLSLASGLSVEKGVNNLGNCLHFSATGQCSCDLLAKTGKHLESWELDLSLAEKLATAVAMYGQEAKSFAFQSRWLVEEVAQPQRIKLQALLQARRFEPSWALTCRASRCQMPPRC